MKKNLLIFLAGMVALCLLGALPTTLNTNQFNTAGPLGVKSGARITNAFAFGGLTATNNGSAAITIAGNTSAKYFQWLEDGSEVWVESVTASGIGFVNSNVRLTIGSTGIIAVDPNSAGGGITNLGWYHGTGILTNNAAILNLTNIVSQTFNLQTANATPANIATISTANNSMWNIFVNVGAASADYSKAGGYFRTYTVRNAAGTTTVVGAVRTIGTDNETDAGMDVTITETDPNILITVTGVLATTINWTCTVQATRVQ